MNVLVWFRHDLRLCDHPALARAAALGRVLPLFVIDPAHWQRPEAAGRHWAFAAECLAGLQADLARLGAPLVLRVGDPVAVIARLARQHRIERVLSMPGNGDQYERDLDRRLAAGLALQGIAWLELPAGPSNPGLVDGGDLDPVALDPVAGVAPGVLPAARALGLAEDACPHRQTGGRGNALTLLAGAVTRGSAGSGLSPWLARGVLAPGELASAAGLQPGLQRAARCRAQMRLRAGLDLVPQADLAGDGDGFAAFAAAETGLPRVDAALRALRATGRLAAGPRALLAGVALHLLALDWRRVGEVLARLSLDHDPGILWPQMQMAAAARPPDPLRSGGAEDMPLAQLRRWLPELAEVPDACLTAPWRWPGAARVLGRRYPEPLIDPASTLRDWRARHRPAAPPAPMVATSAAHSRLDRVLIWAEGRSRAAAPDGQLAFDL